MNNLTNYHSHCSFCDGKAPMEDFFKEAAAWNFTAFGISSHSPVPIEAHANMKASSLPDYLAEFERIKKLYGDKLECLAGLEIDYLGRTFGPAIPLFQELSLDFRIGSIHFLPDKKGEIHDIDLTPEPFAKTVSKFFDGDVEGVVKLYLERMLDMMDAGGFDFVGHCDKVTYSASFMISDLFEKTWFNNLMESYFREIARKCAMLEVNTKHINTWGTFFPNERWFTLMNRLGIAVVVNSDTHVPALINSGRPEALAALCRAGYRSVSELHGAVWQQIPIFL